MNLFKLLISVGFSLFFIGCSFAPFTTPTSGRSVGSGNWEVNASLMPTVGATVTHGFTDNFDAGAILEQQFGPVISVFGKYSVINVSKGFSASAYGGAFVGSGFGSTTGFYAGPVVSYKDKWFETYLSARYSHVTWNLDGLSDDDVDDSFVDSITTTDTEISFAYVQTDFGFNFWFSEEFAWNLHAKHFTSLGDEVEFGDGILPGTALIFHF